MYRVFFRLAQVGVMGTMVVLLAQGCATVNAEREFTSGVKLFRAEKYSEAHVHALNAFSASPNTSKYKSLLGWTHLKQGHISDAESLFSDIHKAEGDNIEAFQGLAWVEFVKGRLPEAKQWFEKQRDRALRYTEEPNWNIFSENDKLYVDSCISDAEFGLGLISLAEGSYSDAEAHLSKALEHRNAFIGHGPLMAAMGDAFYFRERYPEAIGYYRDAMNAKSDPGTAVKLAWCFYFTGEVGRAEEMFKGGLRTAEDPRPFLYGLAFAAYGQGRIPESKECLEELIRLDPVYADTSSVQQLIEKTEDWKVTYKDFAAAYIERGYFEKAHEKLRVYLRLVSEDCEARLMDAWCGVYTNRLPAALTEFDTLSRQEECPATQALLGKGVASLYLGHFDEAETAFREVVSRDPQNTRAKVAQGAVAFLRGDLEKAIHIYTAHLDQLPEKELYFSWPSHALNNLGWSYIRTGRYEEALSIFNRLLAYHPVPIYHEVYDGLGWAFLHLGRMDEARKAFRQSLDIAPQNQSALTGLSKISAFGPEKK